MSEGLWRGCEEFICERELREEIVGEKTRKMVEIKIWLLMFLTSMLRSFRLILRAMRAYQDVRAGHRPEMKINGGNNFLKEMRKVFIQ